MARVQPTTLRGIPAVERLLQHPQIAALLGATRRDRVVQMLRTVLQETRVSAAGGGTVPSADALAAAVCSRVAAERSLSLKRVVNASGVVLHTNLGRAALAAPAIHALLEAASGPVDLELDLSSGRRGRRDARTEELLQDLTGAEAAVVVNNNAAAVVLTLAALARGREVIVSRGELIEIGGSFRLPDVMESSGARLREVGTTNRTHPDDYRRALGPDTALLLKVHRSNFQITGFTATVPLEELVEVARTGGIPLVEDLGSGALVDLTTWGLPAEPVVRQRVSAGADLVTFSGDKLLGGPQAGLVVGRRRFVEQLARHPLARALRACKLTLAALEATLRLYRDAPALAVELPVLRHLARPVAELDAIAQAALPRLRARLGPGYVLSVVDSLAEVGSGAAPGVTLRSRAVRVEHPALDAETIAGRFRRATPPVLGRISDGRFLLDLRTIEDAADLDVALP